jgi:hypothetical protein
MKFIANENSFFKNIFVFLFLGLIHGCGRPSGSALLEAWDNRNRPEIFDLNDQKKFADLPLSGQTPTPWSDTYWPSNRAGIAHRWNGSWPENQFTFPLLTKDEVVQKGLKELASLSPAEKYDLYLGDFSYPLVNYERKRTSPDRAGWEGMCHGWAPASIGFDEPKPVVLESKEGLKIPFGSSDIKALLSLLQGNFYTGRTIFLGGRCNKSLDSEPDRAGDSECKDVNAGTFHLVLTNQIGINKKAFVMDVTRDFEVWNQPVFKYESKVVREQSPTEGAATGTVKEIVVETDVSYGSETMPSWEHLGHSDSNYWSQVTYQYSLELNQDGEIIGGEWLQDRRPDFLWAQDRADFSGYFSALKTIYEASVAAEPGLENPIFLADPTPAPQPAGTGSESQPNVTPAQPAPELPAPEQPAPAQPAPAQPAPAQPAPAQPAPAQPAPLEPAPVTGQPQPGTESAPMPSGPGSSGTETVTTPHDNSSLRPPIITVAP